MQTDVDMTVVGNVNSNNAAYICHRTKERDRQPFHLFPLAFHTSNRIVYYIQVHVKPPKTVLPHLGPA